MASAVCRTGVETAAAAVLAEIGADPRLAHTSHLQVRLDGQVVFDRHLRGPGQQDVFSVTKTVVALTLGVLAQQGRLPKLDTPLVDTLPEVTGAAAAHQTWRQLLTMTRGAEADGPWDIDAVTALAGGQTGHLAAAPQVDPPGRAFRYDNGAAHLISAAASRVLGEPLSAYAQRELFTPLGIGARDWLADPDGVPFGYAHLRLRADDLGRLGQLILDGGRTEHGVLVDPGFLAEMITPHTAGGPPEQLPYGYLIWVADDCLLAGGWAGQHVLVLPTSRAVVVATGDPEFDLGPPPTDRLPDDWIPALEPIRRHLLPLLR